MFVSERAIVAITTTDHYLRLQFAQPVIEVIAHTLIGILWLSEYPLSLDYLCSYRHREAMGAWAS